MALLDVISVKHVVLEQDLILLRLDVNELQQSNANAGRKNLQLPLLDVLIVVLEK